MSAFAKRTILASLISLLTASCGSPRVLPPEPKVNPSPKERYQIAVIVDDPPSAIRVTGNASFAVRNKDCLPMADRIAGVRVEASFDPKISFESNDGSRYIGRLFADWPMPQDYYGQGVCEWYLLSVNTIVHSKSSRQHVNLRGDLVTEQSRKYNLCDIRPISHVSDICESIFEGELGEIDRTSKFIVIIESRKESL